MQSERKKAILAKLRAFAKGVQYEVSTLNHMELFPKTREGEEIVYQGPEKSIRISCPVTTLSREQILEQKHQPVDYTGMSN